jgi:integrative and conjugative element protein (TIGR02256 family)
MKPVTSLEFISDDARFGLKIERKEVQKILRICRSSKTQEVGGIIIGCYNSTHSYAMVKDISNVPIDSYGTRSTFYRGVQGLQSKLNNLWHRTRFFYLGEWHFHPNSPSHASRQDIAQMQQMALTENLCCPEPLLLICGGEPRDDWTFSAYVFPQSGGTDVLCKTLNLI